MRPEKSVPATDVSQSDTSTANQSAEAPSLSPAEVNARVKHAVVGAAQDAAYAAAQVTSERILSPEKPKRGKRKPAALNLKEQGRRANILHDELRKYGFELQGENGPGEIGNTSIWRKEGPKLVPGSDALVLGYTHSQKPSPREIAEMCMALLLIGEASVKPEDEDALWEQCIAESQSMNRSPWRLGNHIARLKATRYMLRHELLADKAIGEDFMPKLSGQQVGLYRLTSLYFADEHRDPDIAFSVYSEARRANDRRGDKALPPAEVAALVYQHRDAAKVKAALRLPEDPKPESHVVVIRVQVVKDGDGWKPDPAISFDGKANGEGEWMPVGMAAALKLLRTAAKKK